MCKKMNSLPGYREPPTLKLASKKIAEATGKMTFTGSKQLLEDSGEYPEKFADWVAQEHKFNMYPKNRLFAITD